MNLKTVQNRNVSFDVLRILAIIMVLYNHRYTFIVSDTFDNISIKYIIGAILSITCKCGPPIFFMVSGALLLRKEEKFTYILVHRVLRIIIVMILCTFLMMYTYKRTDFLRIFSTELNWYLYAYAAYLLMLPFIRKITLHATEKEINLYFLCTLICYTLFGFCIFFNLEFNLLDKLAFYNSSWGSSCWWFIFPISGYFLVRILSENEKKNKYLLFSGILTLISLIMYVILCSLDIKMHNGSNLENLREHAVYPIALFIFIAVSYVNGVIKSAKVTKLMSVLSAATFGVFIIETHTDFSNRIFAQLYMWLSNYMGLYLISIISIIVQFALYSLVVILLRLIPFVKKVL